MSVQTNFRERMNYQKAAPGGLNVTGSSRDGIQIPQVETFPLFKTPIAESHKFTLSIVYFSFRKILSYVIKLLMRSSVESMMTVNIIFGGI